MTSVEFDELYKKATGDPNAMLDIALAFYEGDGVIQSYEQFFAWVEKSANAGQPDAAYELAYAYREGIGIPADYERFLEWLNKATELGSPGAMYDTAIRYKEGDGVSTDEKRFFELMKKAAEKADQDAMLELAFAYRDGMGTAKRMRSYFRWLTKAAGAGNEEAMFHLAFAYKNREGIRRRNIKRFFLWLQEAANKGQPDALFHLAIAHRDGEGTKRSRGQYSRWMKKAAEADIPAAMYHLAMFYLTKTKPNLHDFSDWIKKALKAGYPKAFIASGLDDLRKELEVKISLKALVALHEDLNELFRIVMEIKRSHIIKSEDAKDGVAHFTRFATLDSMLPATPSPERATNRLRLYNFAYMNDPQEGKRLLDKKMPESKTLRIFFSEEVNTDNPLSWEEHESSVYIGSFTLRGDDLDMWRTTYGSNGQGYCIVTPVDAFDQEALNEPDDLHGGEGIKVTKGMFQETVFLETTLYAVRYEEKDVKDTLNKLTPRLEKITIKRRALGDKTKTLDRTVRLIISHILYLYKNKHFKSEEEARLISPFDVSFEYLNLDSRDQPSRLYVESPDFLLKKGSRIIIGPTVERQTFAELDLKYRVAHHQLKDIKISRSELIDLYR
jgi:TPR repeat protein